MEKDQLKRSSKAPKREKPGEVGASKSPTRQDSSLAALQHSVGNRAVQRLIVQRSGDGPFELDEGTEERINHERSGGQAIDSQVQTRMSEATGHDLSGVKVHTSPEADALNRDLGAKAFTTGSDIFFRNGAYQPGSTGGQELLAHELTHVVQQSSGAVGGGGGRMTVNAPGDAFEQEADSVASGVLSQNATPSLQQEDYQGLQREVTEEEEEELQRQEEEEEEEEEVQTQEMPEEEELMMKRDR